MLELSGIKLPRLPVAGLEWVEDLEYFDGPIVSHFRHQRGDHYIRYWVDCDEKDRNRNRWMLVRISENNVIRLAYRFESLDQVIPVQCLDDFVYFFDTIGKQEQHVQLISITDIPEDYTPESGALLRPDGATDQQSFPLLIEDDLTPHDLSAIPRTFIQAYTAIYLLSTPVQKGFVTHPWRGGFSSMHFFNEIPALIPTKDQADVKKIQYSSPGFIRFAAYRPAADRVAHCVALVTDPKSDVNSAYTALGSYIKQHKLNDLPLNSPKWDAHNSELVRRTKRLLDALDVRDPMVVIDSAPRPFEAAKIARSIFNRLSDLARYQKRGCIKLPTP